MKEAARGKPPTEELGYTPLTRGNKAWWMTKMGETFGRKPSRIASVLRAYIDALPSDTREVVLAKCKSALLNGNDAAAHNATVCVIANLRASFRQLARRNTQVNRNHVMGLAAATFGRNMEDRGVLRKAAGLLGVFPRIAKRGVRGHANLMAGAHLQHSERVAKELLENVVAGSRKLSARCLAISTCALIREFWLSPDNTRVSPCKKDVVLARDPVTGKVKTPQEYVSKHWLEATQLVIYRRFQAKYPGLKVGQRSFEKAGVCKPHNVVRLRRRDNISCCCRYHEDMRMVLEGFDKAREAVHSPCKCKDARCCPRDTWKAEHKRKAIDGTTAVCTIAKAGRSTSTFAESLLCPREGDKHNIECLQGTCRRCGGLANFKVCEQEVQHEPPVEWSCYETSGTGQMDDEGKEIKRLQFVQKKTKMAALISKLQSLLLGHEPGKSPNCECKGNFLVKSAEAGQPETWGWRKLDGCGECPFLRPYAYHTFMAQHQQRQFQACVRNLPLGHAVLLFDFSENHSLNIPREVQSLHWVVKQATILVCVVWRHASMEVDGVQSTLEKPVLVKDYVYMLSDDRKHDHRFFEYMRKVVIEEYFVGRGLPKPTFLHEWADGCAAQNKCAAGFADVANSKREWVYGIPCQRNFFETAHAKGEQDGAGAHVKHAAAVAVISEGDKWYAKILCAADLYAFCCERLSHRADTTRLTQRSSFNKRFFYLVPEDALHEVEGGLRAVDHTNGAAYQSVDGTQRMHSVRAGSVEGSLMVRDRSCYCAHCYDQCVQAVPDSAGCLERSHVDAWREVDLRPATHADAVRIRSMVENYAAGVSVAVRRGFIMAVKKDPGDRTHAYYLVKALSAVTEVGTRGRRDDYGQIFAPGDPVISGRYFEWSDPVVRDDYILDTSKKCLIPCEAVLATDVRLCKRGDAYLMPAREHERLLALL